MSSNLTEQLKKAGMHVELDQKALDVVCGMELDPAHTKLNAEHKAADRFFFGML